MYPVNDAMANGKRVRNVFSTTNEHWHSTIIRPVKSLYSVTKLMEVEHGIDATIELFLRKLDERFVSKGRPCDMAEYMVHCT